MPFPPCLKPAALVLLIIFTATACDLRQNDIPALQAAPQTSDWAKDWWLPRHEQKKSAAAKAEVDLLFIGDSITHGWELAGRDIWTRYYAHRKAFNLGFSGDRTDHVLWRINDGALAHIQPKLVVLLIGTNNTGQRMDPAKHTARGIKEVIKQIQQRLPDSKILLLAIFPMKEEPRDAMRQRNYAVNKRIARFADNKRVFFLDIGHIFVDEKNRVRADLMPDFLHPSTAGYQRWAEAMEGTISVLLTEPSGY